MTRTINAAAVSEICAEMDKAKTTRAARSAMARLALSRTNLTPCGRTQWEKELAASATQKSKP
jgi:hypothetical protein